MNRTRIEKSDTPVPQPDDQPLELTLSLVVKGETRAALEALPPEQLRAVLAQGLVAAINKAAETPAAPGPGRTFKRAILSKAEGAEEMRLSVGLISRCPAVQPHRWMSPPPRLHVG